MVYRIRLLRGDNIAPGRVRWDGVKRWSRENAVGLERYALEPGDVVLAMDRPWIPAGLKVAQVQAELPKETVTAPTMSFDFKDLLKNMDNSNLPNNLGE